ncbi:hypothetical protein D3C84_1278640 [compost metagenome]
MNIVTEPLIVNVMEILHLSQEGPLIWFGFLWFQFCEALDFSVYLGRFDGVLLVVFLYALKLL